MEPNSQVHCEEPHHFHRVLVPGGSRECWVWVWEGHPEPQRGVVAPVVRPGQDGAPVCVPVRHRRAWGPGQQGSGLPAHRTGSPLQTCLPSVTPALAGGLACSPNCFLEGKPFIWLHLPPTAQTPEQAALQAPAAGSQSNPGDSGPLSAQECALPPAGSACGAERGPGEVI